MSLIRKNADILGIISSVLCIIHCLAIPVIIAFGMISNSFGHHHHYHWLDYIFVGLAAFAVYYASLKAANNTLKIGLWLSLVVFSSGIFLHEVSHDFLYLSLVGSLALVVLHIFNYRAHRTCRI